MSSTVRVALIGLDTSHSIEFASRMQAPDCPDDQRVSGLRAVSCLRFVTPFQGEEGLNNRQKTLEGWGVRVTTDFDEAVADCDAVMIEINDPARHVEYVKRCAGLGKPVFLDKPLADTAENGQKIVALARSSGLRVFSCSSLRFAAALNETSAQMPAPLFVHTYGPLGRAPAGSSIVWYGVHSFEMLQRAIGRGALSVSTVKDESGVTCIVEFSGGRRGVVELSNNAWVYGGCLRNKERSLSFSVDMNYVYRNLLVQIAQFFRTVIPPVEMSDTAEVMCMLDAAQKSSETGAAVKIVA